MPVYVTGDTHGFFGKFNTKMFPEQKEMTKDDYVIICGDFGGLWDGSKQELKWLNWLESRPFTTLFVDGNHENYDMLAKYPVENWNGGKVQFIRPSIIHLMRGEFYNIQCKQFFTFGGARSHDIDDGILDRSDPLFKQKKKTLDAEGGLYRIKHETWWEQEEPTVDEYYKITGKERIDGKIKVDYIITHCLPSKLHCKITNDDNFSMCNNFLSAYNDIFEFKHWYCGHYHIDYDIDDKFTVMYNKIRRII